MRSLITDRLKLIHAHKKALVEEEAEGQAFSDTYSPEPPLAFDGWEIDSDDVAAVAVGFVW